MFSTWPEPRVLLRNDAVNTPLHPRVEAGSNTSTVTLRVVRGDEKGSLKSETVKYGRESQGTQTRERLRWQGPAAYTKERPVLSSERAPQKNKTVTVKQQQISGHEPKMGLAPKLTDWLTVSRNVTFTLTSVYNHTGAVFSAWPMPKRYLEENSSVREAVKKRASCRSAAVKRILYVWYLECVLQWDCYSSCVINPLPWNG
jgi:hypothetical protein